MDRLQAAVYWPFLGYDAYGRPVVGDPVSLNVRWKYTRQGIGSQAQPIIINATVVVDREIAVGSQMWLAPRSVPAALVQWQTVAISDARVEIMEVASYNYTPDLRNRHYRHVVNLSFLRHTGPSGEPPLRWWKFDENTGTESADSGSTDDPRPWVLVATWNTSSLPEVQGGNIASGRHIADTTYSAVENIELPDPFTLMGWIRLDQHGTGGGATQPRTYLFYDLLRTNGLNVFLDTSNRLAAGTGLVAGLTLSNIISSTGTVPVGDNTHWAIRRQGQQLDLFVDGVQVGSGVLSVGLETSTGTYATGVRNFAYNDGFIGNYDDYRIYDRALTNGEIAAIVAGNG